MGEGKKSGGELLVWLVGGVIVGALLVRGCGSSALPPPVKVSIRDSIFSDRGKVVQITNDSNHHLYNVMVSGRSISDVRGASVKAADVLKPNDTIEVGWMQFKTWAPQRVSRSKSIATTTLRRK